MKTTNHLRVALVSPPWYPVPPVGYGGIELVVYLLAESLGQLGHEVTVFGRQDGGDAFEMISMAPASWTRDLDTRDKPAREATYLHGVYGLIRRRAFDIVHDHTGYVGMLLASALDLQSAAVATLHGDLTEADAHFLAAVDRNIDLVAISRAQQGMVAGVRWAGVVSNAVDDRYLEPREKPGDYLVEIARICPDKGQHIAIEVARRAGRKLVLAGKVEDEFKDYFKRQVEPHLGNGVEWIEDVRGKEKGELLGGALAMLFPIQWEEPFGLAMVEAMATGTPVVATPRGAVTEIVEPGVTGLLAEDVDGLAAAVAEVKKIDRRQCSHAVRERFGARRMAEGYVEVYRAAITRKREAR